MAEHRAVRMGIDVGGTYTKCVAMDNLTHEIIGKNEVKTTHDEGWRCRRRCAVLQKLHGREQHCP